MIRLFVQLSILNYSVHTYEDPIVHRLSLLIVKRSNDINTTYR